MIKQLQQALLETMVPIRKGPKGMNMERAMSMNSPTISLHARRLQRGNIAAKWLNSVPFSTAATLILIISVTVGRSI